MLKTRRVNAGENLGTRYIEWGRDGHIKRNISYKNRLRGFKAKRTRERREAKRRIIRTIFTIASGGLSTVSQLMTVGKAINDVRKIIVNRK